MDSLGFQSPDVGCGGILRVCDDPLGAKATPEERATQLIEEDVVLDHVARSDQGMEDDARLPPSTR
jgi:hypothetical protein